MSEGLTIRSNNSRLEVIDRFFNLEMQKLEIEKIRSLNESKDLELSARSGKDSARIAEKDLDNYRFLVESDYGFRSAIAVKLFRLLFASMIILTGITIYLGSVNPAMLDKLFLYIHDIIKLVIGGAIGYLYRANRKEKLRPGDGARHEQY